MRTTHRLSMVPTARLLRRWLCAWLALLTLTQMLGATLAGVHGAWHRHRPVLQSQAAPSATLLRWRHVESTAPHTEGHAQRHARGEPHQHAATDGSVLPLGLDAASDAVAQLAAVLAPGDDTSWRPRDGARHVRAASAPWAATHRSIAPPLQPPRG